MVRRHQNKSQGQNGQAQMSATESAASIYTQMETLQRELLVLAQRAEEEIESALKNDPQPVTEMLKVFAAATGSKAGAVWFDSACLDKEDIDGLNSLQLLDSDRLQCGIALSGREMAFDFIHGRVFLPVVVFENPLAVAVFEIPGLNSANYENVCSAACDGILLLRKQLRVSQPGRKNKLNAAS